MSLLALPAELLELICEFAATPVQRPHNEGLSPHEGATAFHLRQTCKDLDKAVFKTWAAIHLREWVCSVVEPASLHNLACIAARPHLVSRLRDLVLTLKTGVISERKTAAIEYACGEHEASIWDTTSDQDLELYDIPLDQATLTATLQKLNNLDQRRQIRLKLELDWDLVEDESPNLARHQEMMLCVLRSRLPMVEISLDCHIPLDIAQLEIAGGHTLSNSMQHVSKIVYEDHEFFLFPDLDTIDAERDRRSSGVALVRSCQKLTEFDYRGRDFCFNEDYKSRKVEHAGLLSYLMHAISPVALSTLRLHKAVVRTEDIMAFLPRCTSLRKLRLRTCTMYSDRSSRVVLLQTIRSIGLHELSWLGVDESIRPHEGTVRKIKLDDTCIERRPSSNGEKWWRGSEVQAVLDHNLSM